MTPAAEIARGLTKAQREAVSTALVGQDLYVVRWQYFRSTKALFAKGLIGLKMTPGVLTPLGLEVRAILQAEQEEG